MQNIRICLLILISIILFSNFQCEEEKMENTMQVEYLSYGTSFGECLGYCVREILVSGGVTFTKSGWGLEGSLPDSSCSLVFIKSPLPGYLDDINLDAFLEMNETIGCPDCADGGAEWLELGFENEVKRVTFEYMNEPEELKILIPSLRDLMAGFNDCRSED